MDADVYGNDDDGFINFTYSYKYFVDTVWLRGPSKTFLIKIKT